MIGAVVFRLQAVNAARLPVTQGRLLHAAFFHLLQETSPALSACIHDTMKIKPFTVSEIEFLPHAPKKHGSYYQIMPGQEGNWRVTALHETLLQAVVSIPQGTLVRLQTCLFRIQAIYASPEACRDTGIMDETELIGACLQCQEVQQITFHFSSPVSFRYFTEDYAAPDPVYIFSSLADKWNHLAMPMDIDRDMVRQLAAQYCILSSWEGHSQKVFFSRQRGTLGFVGTFTFSLTNMPQEQRVLFLLLAQFAVFSGTGRMTGQGMGQTRITYQ